MRLRASVVVLATASLLGCYTYAPVEVGSVGAGERVRARLAPAATEGLPASLQGGDRTIEGDLVDRTDGSLTLFVPTSLRQQGFFAESLHERVTLASRDVVELELRRLDRGRTYLLAGIGAAAVAAVAVEVLSGKTGGNTIDNTTPGPSAAVLRLFRFGIP